jgi:hypothetical protein
MVPPEQPSSASFVIYPRLINKQHKITELIMVIERKNWNAEPAPLSITLPM